MPSNGNKAWAERLGEEIVRARRKAKKTQEELCELVGLSRNSIGMYERGERTPDFDVLRRIGIALSTQKFEIDGVSVIFAGSTEREPAEHPEQLVFDFDDWQGVTLRIEAKASTLLIKRVSA